MLTPQRYSEAAARPIKSFAVCFAVTLLKKPLRLFHSTIRRSSQRSSAAASPDGPARRGLFSLGRRLSHQKFVDEADAADVSLGGV